MNYHLYQWQKYGTPDTRMVRGVPFLQNGSGSLGTYSVNA